MRQQQLDYLQMPLLGSFKLLWRLQPAALFPKVAVNAISLFFLLITIQ